MWFQSLKNFSVCSNVNAVSNNYIDDVKDEKDVYGCQFKSDLMSRVPDARVILHNCPPNVAC